VLQIVIKLKTERVFVIVIFLRYQPLLEFKSVIYPRLPIALITVDSK
jgi:hypothetical protein